MAKEGREDGATDPFILGLFERPTHLPEHFALAQHGRFETGGHRKQMAGHIVVKTNGQMLSQLFLGQSGLFGQHLLDLGHRVVEAVDHGVDLGPQTGGEQDRLFQVGLVAQAPEHLVQVSLANRHALQQAQRRLVVFQSYDNNGQPGASLGRPGAGSRQ